MAINNKKELELIRNILIDLLKKITEFYESLSTISILNINLDYPPEEASISAQSREWIIFKDECLDFIEQVKKYVDTTELEKIIEIRTPKKYEINITEIERQLQKIKRQLEQLDLEEKIHMGEKAYIEEKIDSNKDNKKRKLFISHSNDDLKYVKYFVELLEDIGLGEDDLFCSSLREYGVPLNEDIYEYLKRQFKNNDLIVIFMLSNNYYSSVACLNEMGAAWILQSDYYSILLPGFDFNKIKGAINPNRISIKLDNEELSPFLNDLKCDLCSKFSIKINDNKWERVRNTFIDKIRSELK